MLEGQYKCCLKCILNKYTHTQTGLGEDSSPEKLLKS